MARVNLSQEVNLSRRACWNNNIDIKLSPNQTGTSNSVYKVENHNDNNNNNKKNSKNNNNKDNECYVRKVAYLFLSARVETIN
jgi:hypothetical protein